GKVLPAASWAEGTIIVSLILLPLIFFAFAQLLHAGLIDRYALPATLGIVFGIAFALALLGPRSVLLLALFLAAKTFINEKYFWHNQRLDPLALQPAPAPRDHEYSLTFPELARVGTFLQTAGNFNLPVVYADAITYPQVVHYSSSAGIQKLVCLVSQ